jgi:hypothetical protein
MERALEDITRIKHKLAVSDLCCIEMRTADRKVTEKWEEIVREHKRVKEDAEG